MRNAVIAGMSVVLLAAVAQADDGCTFSGNKFSHGATTCQSGTQYRCDEGEWTSLAVPCKPGGQPTCDFQGTAYSVGSTSCQAGTQYRCEGGSWASLGVACPAPGAPMAADAPREARTCMLDGSTVGSSSTVCKAGVTYLCNDGEWRNLGTSCR